MSSYRRAKTKGGTYFFTVVTYRRQKVLCNENVRTALRNGIRNTQITHPFTINAWVLLPDYLHLDAIAERRELRRSVGND
jgi:putative transposase